MTTSFSCLIHSVFTTSMLQAFEYIRYRIITQQAEQLRYFNTGLSAAPRTGPKNDLLERVGRYPTGFA